MTERKLNEQLEAGVAKSEWQKPLLQKLAASEAEVGAAAGPDVGTLS